MNLPTKHDLERWAIQAARGETKLEQEMAASNLLGAAVLYQAEYERLQAFWRTVADATLIAMPGGKKVVAITAVDGVPVSAEVQAPGQRANPIKLARYQRAREALRKARG